MYDFFENHFVHESSSGIKVELKEYNLLRLTVNLPLSEISLELFFFFSPIVCPRPRTQGLRQFALPSHNVPVRLTRKVGMPWIKTLLTRHSKHMRSTDKPG
jgi:hypothetical protein